MRLRVIVFSRWNLLAFIAARGKPRISEVMNITKIDKNICVPRVYSPVVLVII